MPLPPKSLGPSRPTHTNRVPECKGEPRAALPVRVQFDSGSRIVIEVTPGTPDDEIEHVVTMLAELVARGVPVYVVNPPRARQPPGVFTWTPFARPADVPDMIRRIRADARRKT